MNIIELFDHGVRLDPAATAFWQQGKEYSYQEMQDLSCRIGAALAQQTGADNPHVSVLSPNDVQAFACVLGAHRAGGTWVPLNARASLSDNIEFMNTARVQVLFYHSAFADQIEKIRPQVSSLALCVCVDRANGDDASLDAFMARSHGAVPPDLGNDPQRQVAIFATGGTTGKSKGVVHTNLVWETLISEMGHALEGAAPPVHLVVAPMTHAAGGLCYVLMSLGAKNVVVTEVDPEVILRSIQEHQITHLFLPPTIFYALLAHPRVADYNYSSLEYFIVAAAPVSPEKIREGIKVFGPCICQCWGQVEAPMFLTWMPPGRFAQAAEAGLDQRLQSCGRGILQSRVEVMNDAGELLPSGQVGELVVRSNLVTPGYYNNPQATAEAGAFGWHHTGDVGYRDQDGFYFIVDRKKDMIITGGFNVYGAEVEKVLNSHASVLDSAVIGVPDGKWGEAVKAIVQVKPGEVVEPETLIGLCKEVLGSVKAPKSVEFVEALPRSPVGKVLKRELRERYWAHAPRKI